jgi:hypothetical protein
MFLPQMARLRMGGVARERHDDRQPALIPSACASPRCSRAVYLESLFPQPAQRFVTFERVFLVELERAAARDVEGRHEASCEHFRLDPGIFAGEPAETFQAT